MDDDVSESWPRPSRQRRLIPTSRNPRSVRGSIRFETSGIGRSNDLRRSLAFGQFFRPQPECAGGQIAVQRVRVRAIPLLLSTCLKCGSGSPSGRDDPRHAGSRTPAGDPMWAPRSWLVRGEGWGRCAVGHHCSRQRASHQGFFGGSGLGSRREVPGLLRLLRNLSCFERLFRRQPLGFSPCST